MTWRSASTTGIDGEELRMSDRIMREEVPEEILSRERVYAPVHPGEVLLSEWLEPLGMNVSQLARELGVDRQRLGAVVRGKRSITADTALRLARWSGMRPAFWLGLQAEYDLQTAEWEGGERIRREVSPRQLKA